MKKETLLSRARSEVDQCLRDYLLEMSVDLGITLEEFNWWKEDDLGQSKQFIQALIDSASPDSVSFDELEELHQGLAVLEYISKPPTRLRAMGGSIRTASAGLPTLGKR